MYAMNGWTSGEIRAATHTASFTFGLYFMVHEPSG